MLLKTTFPLLLITGVWINLEFFFKYQSCYNPFIWKGYGVYKTTAYWRLQAIDSRYPGVALCLYFIMEFNSCINV